MWYFGGDQAPIWAFTKLIYLASFVNFESQTGFLNSSGSAVAHWHLVLGSCHEFTKGSQIVNVEY